MRYWLIVSFLTGCAGSNGNWSPIVPLDTQIQGEVLTCSIPWADTIPTTNTLHLTNPGITTDIGFSSTFGGIGTLLSLNGVSLLDTRSGTGAAWQWSNLNTGNLGVSTIFNQASGNTVGSQWGESTSFNQASNNLSVNFWDSLYPDTLNSISGMVGQSPCVNTGVSYDYGAPYIETSTTTTINVRNSYTYMAKVDQLWSNWTTVNAIYFTRAIARQTNMRVFFIRNGVIEASAIPYNDFSMPGFNCTNNFSGLSGSFCRLLLNYDYIVLVFTVNGQDLAIVIPNFKSNGVLGLENDIYCTDGTNDACGSIFIFNQVDSVNNAAYNKGQKRTYYVDYLIGTVNQVAYLGYKIK